MLKPAHYYKQTYSTHPANVKQSANIRTKNNQHKLPYFIQLQIQQTHTIISLW